MDELMRTEEGDKELNKYNHAEDFEGYQGMASSNVAMTCGCTS